MASADMAPSTPSPATSIRTPPAPRLGFHDNWEPFSPRKSARISAQRVGARTPSPPPSHRRQLSSPRIAKKSTGDAPTESMASSPRKRRQISSDLTRRAPSGEGSSNAGASLGFKDKPAAKSVAAISRSAGMLPTPSKTPQKPPTEKTSAGLKSVGRNLFPAAADESVLSSPRKRAKKYSGLTMESFTVEEEEEAIAIFTDSRDRLPSKDESESNPFYGTTSKTETGKRRSKRNQVTIPGEGVQSIDEASRREDGMIYVFRGKKFFRKFVDQEEDLEESDEDVECSLPRLTRSSIKPRLLFPVKKTQEMLDEEEEETDVEEQNKPKVKVHEPETPMKKRQERASTPEAPKFAPASPPDTKRITRSTNKLLEQPTPAKRATRKSPFDLWPRTKEHKAPASTKRQGEPLAQPPTKRTRA